MADSTFHIIARIHSDFPTKFGIPRQSGLAKALQATVVFEPEYRNADALRGIEEFSHIWLIWGSRRPNATRGRPRCVRLAWAATPVWACSPPARPSGPTPSGSPP